MHTKQLLAHKSHGRAASHVEDSKPGDEGPKVVQNAPAHLDGQMRAPFCNRRGTDDTRNDSRIIGCKLDGAWTENDHQCANNAQDQHERAGNSPRRCRFHNGQFPFENAFRRSAHALDHQPKMTSAWGED